MSGTKDTWICEVCCELIRLFAVLVYAKLSMYKMMLWQIYCGCCYKVNVLYVTGVPI